MIILNILFALIGLLVGGLLNVLADDLPARVRPKIPHCPRCDHTYGPSRWLAVARLMQGGKCPNCELPTRRRAVWLEIGTALIFAALPSLIEPGLDLVIYTVYTAVLLLIIVIDIEHRLILHVVTFPTTIFALIASFFLTDNNIIAALLGAVVGFIFFYLAYVLGRRLFGAGAFGFGDVTLAMTMGAMLGLHRVIFALVLGVLLGGLWGLFGMVTRRMTRFSYFAYGPFLAVGGLLMLVWGNAVLAWYIGSPSG
jgi:prepilin signal peptidase PulO-like enzyme (type II secretory pathway)